MSNKTTRINALIPDDVYGWIKHKNQGAESMPQTLIKLLRQAQHAEDIREQFEELKTLIQTNERSVKNTVIKVAEKSTTLLLEKMESKS